MDFTKLPSSLDEVLGYLGILLVAAIKFYGKAWLDKIRSIMNTRKTNKFIQATKHSVDIMAYLSEVKGKFNCDRVSIMLRHNGELYANNWHINKLSCAFEVTDDIITNKANERQNILCSQMSHSIISILENGNLPVPEMKDIEDIYFRQLLVAHGAKSAYCYILKDKAGNFIGILILEFCKEEKTITSRTFSDTYFEEIVAKIAHKLSLEG